MNRTRWCVDAGVARLVGAAIALLAGAAASANEREPFRISNAQLEPVAWSEMGGWTGDDHAAAFATFLGSCKVIVRGTPSNRVGDHFYAALQSVCRRAVAANPRDKDSARAFFEQNFRPMHIAPLGETNGFLTGYYEPIIAGSLVPDDEYTVPIYKTPSNLALRVPPKMRVATAGLVRWRKNAHRSTGFYYDRTAIEEGALAGKNLEICYLKDPVDLFFAQIQGSARIRLPDGKVMRLNYDGQNGWPYTPIGRILIERNVVPRDQMSMDRIREWMNANPDEGKELRRQNKSFVFFRETGLAPHEEPLGAQGISLTPGRSIATDKGIHVYGTPFFIEAELPIENEKTVSKFQRLMVAQDTGGAIIGPARADLFFGSGDEPAHVAGRIRHPGMFTMLIPREIDPVAAGERTPIPRARPNFPKIEEKPESKPESKKDDSKKESSTHPPDQKKQEASSSHKPEKRERAQ
jgi:membrane-bound lytic murein transglycosylase A